VKVGDLGDAEAVEGRRKVLNEERGMSDFNLVARDVIRVEGDAGAGKRRGNEKSAAGEERARRRLRLKLKYSHTR
jgi:hypothetical protein